MNFHETPLPGAYVVEMDRLADERGFFARAYCTDEFAAQGLAAMTSQCSVSFNQAKGTLRGLHFQAAPHAEDKLVRCTAGAVFDVIVDLRDGSATWRQWYGVELSASNRRALYVPQGFAHGFITLAEATELFYMISAPFVAGFGRGIRWNDPAIGIRWPGEPAVISPRDADYPLLDAGAPR